MTLATFLQESHLRFNLSQKRIALSIVVSQGACYERDIHHPKALYLNLLPEKLRVKTDEILQIF
ncbi:hypothetical protein [Runella zeae]|uniref:hypothetical protein n=1 Tax=Runella zeae TaxID=94255 RepID=UPI000400C26A|nr:hypothetical protein [Runella zeae]